MSGKTSTILNTFFLTKRLAYDDKTMVTFGRESFPPPHSQFDDMFKQHGEEARGRPLQLSFGRYAEMERHGRLAWIVARETWDQSAVGYACGWWYRDLHFDEYVAAEDLWFVIPTMRNHGIGKHLKLHLHKALKDMGAVRVYENVRDAYHHPKLMADLGYKPWGNRWQKDL